MKCLNESEVAHLIQVSNHMKTFGDLSSMDTRHSDIDSNIGFYDYDHECRDKLKELIDGTKEFENINLCLFVELCALEVDCADDGYREMPLPEVRELLATFSLIKPERPMYPQRQRIEETLSAGKEGIKWLLQALMTASKNDYRDIWGKKFGDESFGERGCEIVNALIKQKKE